MNPDSSAENSHATSNGHAPARTASPGSTLYSRETWRAMKNHLGLSPRELQITLAIFDDLSEPAMAEHLGISVHTVHTYLKRLYRKLEVRSRVELVCIVVASQRGLAN